MGFAVVVDPAHHASVDETMKMGAVGKPWVAALVYGPAPNGKEGLKNRVGIDHKRKPGRDG